MTFAGNGWAYFEQLEQCEESKLSFEFATQLLNALLLYNGPMVQPSAGDVTDFISVELNGGMPRVRLDMGDGEVTLTVTTATQLHDGNWHTIEIYKQARVSILYIRKQHIYSLL